MMRSLVAVALVFAPVVAAAAPCVNRFVQRRESSGRWVITLLTGRLTFQEAQTLAHDIEEKRAEPIEWVDGKGKTIARQLGELRVVRPMPVACDDKPSGVIMVVTFLATRPPEEKMLVRLEPKTVVLFMEQKE